MLSISKNTSGHWRMFFPVSKFFTSTKSYQFWCKVFINNSQGVTWRFRPRKIKNSEIDGTICQKKQHSELQKFKKGNVAALWLCKKLWLRRPETFGNEWQKREHFLRILFNVASVVNIKLELDELIFLLLDNTNYVMQNLISKFRQCSIISRNQVICLKSWKLWQAPTTIRFNIFN